MSHENITAERPDRYVEDYAGKRITFTTKKPFDDVVAAVRASVTVAPSHILSNQGNRSAAEYTDDLMKGGPSRFFLFTEYNHGGWYKTFVPRTPKFHKFVIGNPLVIKGSLQYDIVASLHAPWSFLIVEIIDKDENFVGTKVVYESPTAILSSKVGGKALDIENAKVEQKLNDLVSSWL